MWASVACFKLAGNALEYAPVCVYRSVHQACALLLHSISSYTVWVVCISLITHHGQLLILWLDVAPSEIGANTVSAL